MYSTHINVIASSTKLGISLSDVSPETKQMSYEIIDIVANLLKSIKPVNAPIDIQKLALKHNIDKIILVPLPNNLCLVKVYGSNSKEFIRSADIPFLEDMGINTNSFDFFDDSHGIVVYDKTTN